MLSVVADTISLVGTLGTWIGLLHPLFTALMRYILQFIRRSNPPVDPDLEAALTLITVERDSLSVSEQQLSVQRETRTSMRNIEAKLDILIQLLQKVTGNGQNTT